MFKRANSESSDEQPELPKTKKPKKAMNGTPKKTRAQPNVPTDENSNPKKRAPRENAAVLSAMTPEECMKRDQKKRKLGVRMYFGGSTPIAL